MKGQYSHGPYSQGPLEEPEEFDLRSRHKCTDPLCCLLFIGALCAFGALYRLCLKNGNINRISHGIDWSGRVCGVDTRVSGKKYLYWCAVQGDNGQLEFDTGKPICVSQCPDGSVLAPVFSVQPECALVSGNLAQMVPYRTIVLLDRYCIPDVPESRGAAQKITSHLNNLSTNFSEELSSLPAAWPVLALVFAFSVILGYVYLVMLRHCAEFLIWASIVASIAGFVILGGYFWMNAEHIVRDVLYENPEIARQLVQELKGHEETGARIAGMVCWVVAGLLVCLANCLHHSIHVASLCVEVACEAIFDMPSLLLAPVCKVTVKGAVFGALLYGFCLLWSAVDMAKGEDGVIRAFAPSDEEKLAMVFYVTMSLWILAFLNALYQFIVAYAIVEYYYTPLDHNGRKVTECCAMLEGLQVGIFLHSGSLAFGSLLIALLTVLQWLIDYADHQNKESGGNRVVGCIIGCLECLVSCCKDLVQRVNRIAYVEMAISSENFCDSAQKSLGVVSGIMASMGILTGATVIFTIFGVLVITLAASFFAYATTMGNRAYMSDASVFNVDSPVTVTWAAAGIGALVSMSFMNIFDVASDTMLYCYQTDKNSGGRHDTAPALLHDLFGGSGR